MHQNRLEDILEYISLHILYMIGYGVRYQRSFEICGPELELKPKALDQTSEITSSKAAKKQS